jgi:hypothetical protein
MRQRLIDSLCVWLCFQNEDLAVDLFKNALKAFPNSSHTYQAWACLEKDRGNWELAFQVRSSSPFVSFIGWVALRVVCGKRSDRLDFCTHCQACVCSLYPKVLDSHIGCSVCVLQLFRLGIEKRPWDGGAYQPYALALKERREVGTPPGSISVLHVATVGVSSAPLSAGWCSRVLQCSRCWTFSPCE